MPSVLGNCETSTASARWTGTWWERGDDGSLKGEIGSFDSNANFDLNWYFGSIVGNHDSLVELHASMEIVATRPSTVTFTLGADDGYRLSMDGEVLIDDWSPGSFREQSVTKDLSPGIYKLVLNYFESTGGARVMFDANPEVLEWPMITSCSASLAIPPASRYAVWGTESSHSEIAKMFGIPIAQIIDAGLGFDSGQYLVPGPPVRPRKVIVVQGIDSEAKFDDLVRGDRTTFLTRSSTFGEAIKLGAWSRDTANAPGGVRAPDVDEEDIITFSYAGTYVNPVTGTGLTTDLHSGTGDDYAIYSKENTCEGVRPAAVKLDRLIKRIVDLQSNMEIDIVAHSMGGLVTAYMLATGEGEHLEHIRSVTTLDSPLRGTLLRNVFTSACFTETGTPLQAWLDLLPNSEAVAVIAGLEGTDIASKFNSINSAIGSALPGETLIFTYCSLPLDVVSGHTCVWSDQKALSIISDTVNTN